MCRSRRPPAVDPLRPALPYPCLALVTDRRLGQGDTLPERVAAAVAGGVDLVQLREKDLPGGRLLELAAAMQEKIDGRALLLVNERVDVAAALPAAGVQLGEDALPLAAARRQLGPDALIGRSVHSRAGAKAAVAAGADFLVAGTMYASRSHPGEPPAGPELICQIAAIANAPLIGIGGITAANVGAVMQAGAAGVAVITGILAAPDPERAAAQLKAAMRAALTRLT